MFLAINEIRYSKLRYALVIGVMFLIAYLVFFLTGLAYGLAQDNRTAIDNWQADDILLADEANNNLNMSMIPLTKFEEVKAEEKAYLTQTAGVIQKEKGKEKIDVTFFGINQDQFLAPKISEGRMFHSDDETVADSSVKEQYELNLGDTVQLAGSDKKLKIVGFTKNAKFSVAPVLYTTVGAYQEIRFETQGRQTSEKTRVNAIVTRGNVSKIPDELKKISIKTFINDLPGYSAQVLTFGFMIGFLIVIAAIVIGIFIYVLTMQKADVFGVMKAQGISSRYIANSVIVQTFLLAIIGVAMGLVGTLGTSLLLPEAVPFQVNLLFFLSISILMIVIAVLGALFSVRTIVKIDPLKAIG
ncbi:ABC transporter permease [Enterococcus thailandicus]|uniref:ABC transporter permease n=1 Tax=Enterococcus thailandicus TaxID=417368 RepID=UPI0022EBC0B8|nr:ABC transporter permease [Enterococcus thailandicus]MDA3974288.1 ABC transporter permease [Enterococcus thailandicus]MDA3976551.1 ABC transporter permease [Enterococcus thailandicus]MDA3981741.1 ABC transporter permease [Enterococcus thailandicus]